MFVCLGLIIATITFARNPFDPPGKHGKPEYNAIMADGCVIKYTAPKNDGGSPILGYLIQYKSKYYGGTWEKVNRDSINALECRISNMQKGDEGCFRVIAVNKAGRGEPSDASDPITFKD